MRASAVAAQFAGSSSGPEQIAQLRERQGHAPVHVGRGKSIVITNPSRAPLPADQPKCVLLVEDEFLIRVVVAEELRDQGFRVIEACSADEALAVIDGSTPDLVITDVRMPGSIDGLDLLAIINVERSDVPVIVTSGHLEATHAISCGAAAFLLKPFTCEAMIEAAKSVLTER